MTRSLDPDDLRTRIIDAIVATAPDVADDIDDVGRDVDLFEEYGLDSMDRMNIMTALVASTGVDIPDDKYPQLSTMNQLADHLADHPDGKRS